MSDAGPSFPFYPDRWLGSPRIQALSWEARGVHFELMCFAWASGSIPSDPAKVRRMLGVERRKFSRIWAEVRDLWTPVDGDGDKLECDRLATIRAQTCRRRDALSERGRVAANARWASKDGDSGMLGHSSSNAQAMPSSSSSSLRAKHARAQASSERSGKERSEPERARVFFDQVEKEFRKATGAAWVWGYGEWTAAEALEAEHGADAVVERWRALLEHPDPWYVSARTMSALTAKWNALAPQTPQDEPGEDFLPEWARETSEPETPAEGKP